MIGKWRIIFYIPFIFLLINQMIDLILEPKIVIEFEDMKYIKLRDDRIIEYFENDIQEYNRTILFIHDILFSGHICNLFQEYFNNNSMKLICPSIPGFGLSDFDKDHDRNRFILDLYELLKKFKNQEIEVIGIGTGNVYLFEILKSFKNIKRIGMISPKRPLFNGTHYFDLFNGHLLIDQDEFYLKLFHLPFISHFISYYIQNHLLNYYSFISLEILYLNQKLKNELIRSCKRDFRIISFYYHFIQNLNYHFYPFNNTFLSSNLLDDFSNKNHQDYLINNYNFIHFKYFNFTHFQLYQNINHLFHFLLMSS